MHLVGMFHSVKQCQQSVSYTTAVVVLWYNDGIRRQYYGNLLYTIALDEQSYKHLNKHNICELAF